MKSLTTLCLLFLLAFPGSAEANPSVLGGPYIFVGGGAGVQFSLAGDSELSTAFRWGPSLELGGDMGPLTLAVGADLRVPVLPLIGVPLDIDTTVAIGLISPTPLIRLYARLRAGVGWRFLKGASNVGSVLIAPDLGLRFRLPKTKAAFQVGIASGPRIVPKAMERAGFEVELRLGLKFL